MNVIFMRTSY